jgi:hypothetical protein
VTRTPTQVASHAPVDFTAPGDMDYGLGPVYEIVMPGVPVNIHRNNI